jgi:phosphohistidine phosphatase
VLFLSTANIYDKTVEAVQALGLDSECVGGGRIKHDAAAKKILVYGYSQVISAS